MFGHHFAAISGAGPLIGPVLAIQFGYMPGLLWLIVGFCLAGGVQDMLVLAASVRHDGKSPAEFSGNAKLIGFCDELFARRECLWTFTQVEGIEPTNNTAERALRPAVINGRPGREPLINTNDH